MKKRDTLIVWAVVLIFIILMILIAFTPEGWPVGM